MYNPIDMAPQSCVSARNAAVPSALLDGLGGLSIWGSQMDADGKPELLRDG